MNFGPCSLARRTADSNGPTRYRVTQRQTERLHAGHGVTRTATPTIHRSRRSNATHSPRPGSLGRTLAHAVQSCPERRAMPSPIERASPLTTAYAGLPPPPPRFRPPPPSPGGGRCSPARATGGRAAAASWACRAAACRPAACGLRRLARPPSTLGPVSAPASRGTRPARLCASPQLTPTITRQPARSRRRRRPCGARRPACAPPRGFGRPLGAGGPLCRLCRRRGARLVLGLASLAPAAAWPRLLRPACLAVGGRIPTAALGRSWAAAPRASGPARPGVPGRCRARHRARETHHAHDPHTPH